MARTFPPASAWLDALALTALRVVAALLYLAHGVQKLTGFPAPFTMGSVAPGSLLWFSALLELGLGTLMALGVGARVTAFVAAGHMAVAYFMAHAPRGALPVTNGGDAAVLFCFVFLFLAIHGGGPWTVAAVFNRSSGD